VLRINEGVPVISKQDRDVASLKSLISDLGQRVNSLADEIDALSDRARESIRRKNRIGAMRCLRSKRALEAVLDQRSDTLQQLEDVLRRIEQAADRVEVVEVLRSSTKVLQSLNVEIGGAEHVDGVLDALRDELSKADEISSILGEAGQSIDDAEADDELEALERSEKAKLDEQEAQRMRERLEEAALRAPLGDVDGKTTTNSSKESTRPETQEEEIEESISAMGRMSLDETKQPNSKIKTSGQRGTSAVGLLER
jgi:charged multivesicular body protein 7